MPRRLTHPAITLALSLSLSAGCGGEPAPPDLTCPKGMVPAWVDQPAGLAECQPDLPLRDGSAPRTGLQAPFPDMVRPPGNLLTPERIELGRLLFYDPLLSGDNQVSCAHCHHPDIGFSDGRPKAVGVAGAAVPRHTPTIWNAAFNKEQFWDGRAPTLEEQAKGPIQAAKEMDQDPAELVRELRAVPEYVERFDRAFNGSGGSAITFDNVATAIAAFERTVLTYHSPYDRYAAGETGALLDSARRGLNLFRSLALRCFECHGAPTFANPDYKVLGLPDLENPSILDGDMGRADVVPGERNERAFKVPTLRNVTLRAPYMHNGALRTLEDVIDYYARGGGPGRGYTVPNIDDKIRKYDLSEQERGDLIEFLKALTDESLLPAVPARVPSGHKVVERLRQ